ncbi:MAG: hypothetical protein IE922_15555, partial [Sphingomonadales bacterium]|nr:hypothetical protein [Sphingomonadales bacterium]
MRRIILSALLASLIGGLPAAAEPSRLIPERRMMMIENRDIAGRDLAQIFDTSFAGCEAACLADPSCEAITFNARNNSCFPKAEPSAMTEYQGAFSGV